MTRHADRPIRADARRNRERLLATASRLFADAGTDVSLAAVAKAAGVGIGTVYRHFPTHDALVEAVYRNEAEQLCARGEELLRSQPADVALEQWLGGFVDYAATKRGMADALRSFVASGSEIFAEARRQIVGTLTTLLEAGAAAGTIRPDVTADDVIGATASIFYVPDQPGQSRRVLALVMDGLRHGATGVAGR